MNRFRTVKNEKEAQLLGVSVELTVENGTTKGIKVTDANGKFLIVKGDYSISVLVQDEPKKKSAWELRYKLLGKDHAEQFEELHDANQREQKIRDEISGIETSVEQVEVVTDGI